VTSEMRLFRRSELLREKVVEGQVDRVAVEGGIKVIVG
jgi:hypothetical protein